MEAKDQVLAAMKKANETLIVGKVVVLNGLVSMIVEKAMNELKKEGSIESPKRCYWQPKS